jgi:hypothetical protein
MTKKFESKELMLEWCAKQFNSSNELAFEFGVCTGYSISIIRNNYLGPIYGFDSFEGLPEFWRDGFDKGYFKTDSIPKVKGVEIIVGLFQDTLKYFLNNNIKETIKLVHFDADLYSSTIYCLNEIKDYLSNECVFIFDEYENYPGWEDHEYKAFNEWLAKNKDISAERIAEVINNEQVAFKVTI